MKSGKKEFLSLLCKLYMVALLVALPLYTGEGYWNLGDTKYMLFKNVSCLCLGLWLVVGICGTDMRSFRKWRKAVSMMDLAMAAYGIIVVLSALLSDYGQLAWKGYGGWYMGALSQLLFVGTYFVISRGYDGARWPLYLGEIALFLVTLFGLLHRLGIDPLKLLVYWSYRDWEYSHMLSTLGNINWLCGYYSVALAFLAVHFLQEERIWLEAMLYVGAVAAFVLLAIQGSQGGWLILMVCVASCLFLGWGRLAVLKRVCGLLTGFFFCMPIMGYLMKIRGNKAAVVLDGNIYGRVGWHVWLIAGGICVTAYVWLWRKGRILDGRRPGRLGKAVLLGGIGVCMSAVLIFLLGRGIDDSFGNGRGFLWRIALESFEAADVKDRLLGAGPDCYGEAVFNRLGAGSDVWKGDHWENAVYTNAHNEFLSQLCNVGIFGTVSYLAIFLIGLYRCWRGIRTGQGGEEESGGGGAGGKADSYELWVGLLAIAMYGAHSLISFQQVLNAPLLFLVLGLCEERLRRGGHHEVEEV